MPSVVAICNMALAKVGTRAFIASLDEDTPEARLCSAFFDQALVTVLAAGPWTFATRRQALALLAGYTPPPEWAYGYGRPDDCLRPRYLADGRTSRRPDQVIPYLIEQTDDGAVVILSNQPEAVLVFTGRTVDPALFPPGFTTALSWQLAIELATPLNRSVQDQTSLMRAYEYHLGRAQVEDMDSQQPARGPISAIEAARR